MERPIGELKIRVYEDPGTGGKSVYIFIEDQKSAKRYCGTLVFEEVGEGVYFEPTFRVTRKEERVNADPLVGLIEELWKVGYRPRDKSDSLRNDEISALNNHLQDMRKIVFDNFLRR